MVRPVAALARLLVVLLVVGACASTRDEGAVATNPPVTTATAPPATSAPSVATTSVAITTSPSDPTSSTPVPSAPAGPCEPRGYVTGPSGAPVDESAESLHDVAVIFGLGDSLGPVYPTEYGRTPRPFDWDEDGLPDTLRMDTDDGRIEVVAAAGIVEVTGVRTDFSDVSYHSTVHGNIPATVGDVNGDTHPDLVVASDGWVGILLGAGPDTTSVSVAFDRIGADGPGWSTPPAITSSAEGTSFAYRRTAPWGTAEPMLYDDLDGDGLTDIGLYNHHERTAGSMMLLLGQPCPAQED